MAKMGCALIGLGRSDEAVPLLAELEKRAETEPICPSAVATLHLYLGDKPAFYRWLKRAHDEREPFALALHVERLWEPAWGDPEYQEIVERVGLARKAARVVPGEIYT
jgi:hypothetical protein